MAMMWIMTEIFWGTGKSVIIYIGLCVFKGLIVMYDIGVYESALVKKSRYWPSGIYGDQINAHLKKEMG